MASELTPEFDRAAYEDGFSHGYHSGFDDGFDRGYQRAKLEQNMVEDWHGRAKSNG